MTSSGLHPSQHVGGTSLSPQEFSTTTISGGGRSSDRTAIVKHRGRRYTLYGIRRRIGVAIRRESRLKRGIAGLSGLFGVSSPAGKNNTGALNVDVGSAREVRNNSQGSAGRTVRGAHGEEGRGSRGRTSVEGKQRDIPAAARRIGQTLPQLLLAKVKIVIGKRTHDATHRRLHLQWFY